MSEETEETIGELADRLPPGVEVNLPEYGLTVRRWPESAPCYALTAAGRGVECGIHGKTCKFAEDAGDRRWPEPATSGGVPLTDDVIEALAAEAERGYDPERLRSRPRTAPVSGEPHDSTEYCEVCRGYRDDPHECEEITTRSK